MTAMVFDDRDRPALSQLGTAPVFGAAPVGALVWHEGIRWHVRITGSGPAMLLLHGTGASSDSFDGLAKHLSRRHTIVAPDLPGHALTHAPRRFVPSLPNMARALGRLLAELEVSPVAVVGHSAGAAVLAQMALDRSIAPRLLVGVGAALFPIPSLAGAVLRPMAKLLSRTPGIVSSRIGSTVAVERLLRGVGSSLDSEGIERYRQLSSRPDHVRATLEMMASWDLEPLFRALPRLRSRVLLIAGRNDRAISIAQQRAVVARLPHGALVEMAGAGHLLHEERPEETAELITRHEKESSSGEGPSLDEDGRIVG
ncbi:MAG: alpha/beta fold hydrolase [Deltaproteobacteria bacterium]|nr:alpha/beta fold hydrolase [Deltaproteobacteria bacterium]